MIDLQAFDDERAVEVEVGLGPAPVVVAPVAGVLTGTTCSAGAQIVSGATVARVGGSPVVALATGTPLWREIKRGLVGEDVRGLNSELRRLGYDVPDKDIATSSTLRAGLKLASLPSSSGVIPLGAFSWIPSTTSFWDSCAAPIGGRVGVGDVIGTLEAPVESVRPAIPERVLPGDRALTMGGVDIPLDAPEELRDSRIDALSRSSEFLQWKQRGDKAPMKGVWRLATPVQAARVPASSVSTSGASTCVSVGGEGRPVRVVSSTLGQSIISFPGEVPQAIDLIPPTGLQCP